MLALFIGFACGYDAGYYDGYNSDLLPDRVTLDYLQRFDTSKDSGGTDDRTANLTRFFTRYHASTAYINDYINAADKYDIDYRLLPAISVAESSAGQHACGNNWWGWQSCKGNNFVSVAQGIQFVSDQLANGNYYRGKSIDEKLRAYNPNPAYAPRSRNLYAGDCSKQMNAN